MFDIGAAELLLVAIVALVVIGPKDLPAALRGVGRVIGQLRSFTGQFRFSLDAMIREAEVEGQEKEWAQKNADIMAEHPSVDNDPLQRQPAAEARDEQADQAAQNAETVQSLHGETKIGEPQGDAAGSETLPAEENRVAQSGSNDAVSPGQADENPQPAAQDDLFGDKK